MRALSKLSNEIKVVETILGQLQDCLLIFHEQKMYSDFRRTQKDIQIVKKELKQLYVETKTINNTDQGETGIDATIERHSEDVS